MYFDAIKGALKQIADPGVDEDVKKDLKRQLHDLDPAGEIRAFVSGSSAGQRGTPVRRPDLSRLIAKNRYIGIYSTVYIDCCRSVQHGRVRNCVDVLCLY